MLQKIAGEFYQQAAITHLTGTSSTAKTVLRFRLSAAEEADRIVLS